ncbi:hypothetical protein C8F04DRAFT_1080069 [Mycena alexandri]|uniref:Uncharacterized protein n=1 Tax=Mycena alexandri TaxID=1745969 RepID=A0AAD6T9C9_9AGAR|nr:hypothetical protein C8F04DRAFT_1080069 [Mycena alexandri]
MDLQPEPSLPGKGKYLNSVPSLVWYRFQFPKLILVAWRVKEWVEPLLYQTAVLHGSTTTDGYPTFTQSALIRVMGRNPALLRSSVRNLYLYQPYGVTRNDIIMNTLSHFPAVENLSLGAKFGEIKTQSDATAMKLIADMPLKRFCGDFRPLLRDFPLTHPRCTLRPSRADSPLTHLAFDHPNIIPECLALLQNGKSLRVLVFFGLGLGEQEWCQKYLAPLSHDPRFLAMEEAWYVEDWHIGVREGLDFWARAEDFIARRRTGEINLLQYEIFYASIEEEEDDVSIDLFD